MNCFSPIPFAQSCLVTALCFIPVQPAASFAQIAAQPVTVAVADKVGAADLPPQFLGLSYESSELLPLHGHYYFDAKDKALVQTFLTLGIKSLRVGANAVDDPKVAVPQEKDIDVLFNFARATGVKVIYSFRLKNGKPADSARLASYVAAHDADQLDCFAIGNEPNFYLKTIPAYLAHWKPHRDAILQAVPDAKFDAPSVAGNSYLLGAAKALFPDGHLVMASAHYYFFGYGRTAEKDPAGTRARFLSNDVHKNYEMQNAKSGAVLAAEGIPYRIDELNSCYAGGAKGASDTYASALWVLDCTHWWATHPILGMNYHTNESVKNGKYTLSNYGSFVHRPGGDGFDYRPQSYGLMAFSQGAHGKSMEVKADAAPTFNFNAYAYRDQDGSIYVTLINKSYGDKAQPADVSVQLPSDAVSDQGLRLDLTQKDSDVAAQTGLTLGGAPIDPQGNWSGQWQPIKGGDAGKVSVEVAPASATIIHFSAAK